MGPSLTAILHLQTWPGYRLVRSRGEVPRDHPSIAWKERKLRDSDRSDGQHRAPALSAVELDERLARVLRVVGRLIVVDLLGGGLADLADQRTLLDRNSTEEQVGRRVGDAL